MKARKVKGLKRGMRLDDAAQRIVAVRLDELCAFMPRAGDPQEMQALHDMRIAAKRLRYVLELTDGFFGPYAAKATRRTRELQDLIGEIHDCDETLPRVLALRDGLGPARMDEIVGLETVAEHLRARREHLHREFCALWLKLSRGGFRARLEFALRERADAPGE